MYVFKKNHTNNSVSCLFDVLAFSSAKERAQCFALGMIDQGELCLHLILHNWKQKVTSHCEQNCMGRMQTVILIQTTSYVLFLKNWKKQNKNKLTITSETRGLNPWRSVNESGTQSLPKVPK